jgi:hypothetical protein
MGDQWMNDCLVTYNESDVFDSIEKESIMQRFQNMKTRRKKLLNFFFFFDNLGCLGQRSVDTRTLTNPRGTCNTLLTCIPR